MATVKPCSPESRFTALTQHISFNFTCRLAFNSLTTWTNFMGSGWAKLRILKFSGNGKLGPYIIARRAVKIEHNTEHLREFKTYSKKNKIELIDRCQLYLLDFTPLRAGQNVTGAFEKYAVWWHLVAVDNTVTKLQKVRTFGTSESQKVNFFKACVEPALKYPHMDLRPGLWVGVSVGNFSEHRLD